MSIESIHNEIVSNVRENLHYLDVGIFNHILSGRLMMENDKPRLSLDEQIQHLKDKGILFNIMDEESAKQYLKYNNNYYKLTSFRKIMISIQVEKIRVNILGWSLPI